MQFHGIGQGAHLSDKVVSSTTTPPKKTCFSNESQSKAITVQNLIKKLVERMQSICSQPAPSASTLFQKFAGTVK
jgi:hypothetical protein